MSRRWLALALTTGLGIGLQSGSKAPEECNESQGLSIICEARTGWQPVYTVAPNRRVFIQGIIADPGGPVRIRRGLDELVLSSSGAPTNELFVESIGTAIDFGPGETIEVECPKGANLFGAIVHSKVNHLPTESCEAHPGMVYRLESAGTHSVYSPEETILAVPSDQVFHLEELRLFGSGSPTLEIASQVRGPLLRIQSLGDRGGNIRRWIPLSTSLRFGPGDVLRIRDLRTDQTGHHADVEIRGTLRPALN